VSTKHNGSTDAAAAVPRISEIVLKTSRYDQVRRWYETVLGVTARFERTDPSGPTWAGAMRLCFIPLHMDFPYTQTLAIFEIPAVRGVARATEGEPGLHHMQLRHQSLTHMVERYEHLKAKSIIPVRSFNHGPATSFYYCDPDGNSVEVSAANFVEQSDYVAYFQSDAFKKNVSGIEIDPQEFAGRLHAGVPQEKLVRI